ncbi:hypothetical protein F8M41_016400 [Gigaspora margarita]|uniref:Uncharacterized protein n=1 Tax=Gigaspora margarita TaxID=4874 RepID=A0A8H3ZYU7_GIGMA|nr:hypothetical protein F8M41_016400 [Gigaspora margarita]
MLSNILFFLAYSGSHTSFAIRYFFSLILFGFLFFLFFVNIGSTRIISFYNSSSAFLWLPQIHGVHAPWVATVMVVTMNSCFFINLFWHPQILVMNNLTSQVSFRDFDELRNARSEGYPITPPSESFGSESSFQGLKMNSLTRTLIDYGFDNDSNPDAPEVEVSCEYFGGSSSFYCDSCNHPTFECVCCWRCHYSPMDCICNPKFSKVFNCDEYNTGYCSSSDDGFSNGLGTDNEYNYNSDCKYYCFITTYG